ncbi:hypothetical protein [Propionibacterium freudenreichii]|uniref:hypothetical protein n=1 Tax=Propionibacterium freudenreichii TaxID=1744 RepID=UPI00254C4767|nr:hypothetical protein [Propionibacterium freudenreichii]MDK9302433.1 hypothetical protein [Propionibacterium freudenreichii]MDK9341022.1 hypothetical protein [Propionibacterium freudenreichii]MDK9649266.1 hypothetical protein [Propionibacterium freudenreichii]
MSHEDLRGQESECGNPHPARRSSLPHPFTTSRGSTAREYVFHHPEDERYVPVNLPEPDLINIKPIGGLVDMDFDGEPLFAPNGREG